MRSLRAPLTLSPRAIEADVLPRGRIFDRLQVGENRCRWQRRANLMLENLQEIVTLLDRPTAGDKDVQGDESTGACLPCTNGVELGAVVPMTIEDALEGDPLRSRDGRIKEAERRPTHKLDSGLDDVDAYRQGDERIEPEPAGERYGSDTDQHPA